MPAYVRVLVGVAIQNFINTTAIRRLLLSMAGSGKQIANLGNRYVSGVGRPAPPDQKRIGGNRVIAENEE